MKDEIKEILEDIDKKECYYIGTNGCLYQDLTKEQLLLIKDYITNLQEENKKFKNWINVLNKNNHNYKSRNEKAIEYIKNEMPYLQEVDEEFENVDGEVYFTYKEWNGNELLNILEGDDKNENR